ncbi:MAG: pyrroloquinoline quinone biosynthesis peptide chaperone PqqD [Myxococcaceae bacterium]
MIPLELKPKLSKKARVQRDKVTGKNVLLYPERGLVLNDTAYAIVERCDGARTVGQIVDELVAKFEGAGREEIAREVQGFLQQLFDRTLLDEKRE